MKEVIKEKTLRFSSKLKSDIAYNKGVIKLFEGAEDITIINSFSALADPILSRFYQGASLYNSTIDQFYKRTMRHSVTYAVDVGFVFIVLFEIGKCSIPLIGDFLWLWGFTH